MSEQFKFNSGNINQALDALKNATKLDYSHSFDSGLCRLCSGRGWVLQPVSEFHSDVKGKCHGCKGTGVGESLETYWRRNGITPKRD